MNERKATRLRRAKRARHKIKELKVQRLSVYRSPRHIYAQIIDDQTGQVVAHASTLEPSVKINLASGGGNVSAASAVGKAIAESAKAAGVTRVAFDRSGYKYHGRVKALADAARESGLEF